MTNDNSISSDNLNGEKQNAEPAKKIVINTFGELREVVKKAQKENRISRGTVNNAQTAFSSFLESRNLKDDSPISGFFDDEDQFESYLKEFDRHLKGKSKSTRASYISHVRYHYKIYNLLAEKKLPDTFHEALLSLLTNAGFTIYGFWRLKIKSFVTERTFRLWCSGQISPSLKSIKIIAKIEEILGVTEGTLLDRLSRRLQGRRLRPTCLTSFGRKMQNALKNRYGVWTSQLQEQFEKLKARMSSAARPEGQERNSVWTSSDGADVPTSNVVKSFLRSFFGFCCLPKAEPDPYRNDQVMEDERATAYNSGMGMKKEEMTLALLTVKHLVVTYLEFQRVRAGGIYTTGSTTFINMVRALLRPESGYIYQHSEFAKHLEGVIEDDGLTWHERCVQTRARLLEILNDLEEADLIDYGRDPMESIQSILDLDRPLSVIFLMLEAIKKDLPPPKAPIRKRAEHFRNYLLLLMLTAVPLRIRMYSIMRIGEHLIREVDGSWWLKFSRKDFKNRRAKKRGRGNNRNSSRRSNRGGIYKIQLPPEVWPHIEEYLENYRPHLFGAASNNFLFLPVINNKGKRASSNKVKHINKGGITAPALSLIVLKMTYFYIPIDDNPGFGPHAFRHIVATDIIKQNPSVGFFLAAIALNDELETVEEEYVHLKTSEFFKPVSEHFSHRMHEARLLMAA